MTKMLLAALAAVSILFTQPIGAEVAVNPVREAAAATVPMEVLGTSTRYCSAVVIAPERVLTAAHCLPSEIAQPSVRRDDKQYPVAGWTVRPADKDLAEMIVPGLDCPCVPVKPGVAKGDAVMVLGYPDGGDLVITEGVVVSVARVICYSAYDCRTQAITTARIRRGNSGGAVVVIRDSRAYLVAILVGGTEDLSSIELL